MAAVAAAADSNKTKYDRQLRIWGEQGQAALEKASVCLLNCGPTGSEALKNLVLGGIGSITVIDGSKVEAHDLGNNFVRSQFHQIINDSASEVESTSSDFWVMVAALKEYIENEGDGEPPLEGSIPDMTSSTESYVSLQKIYQAKAESDCLAVEQRVRDILKRIGRDPNAISKPTIRNFCKNARKLSVCRYRCIEDEFKSPSLPELQKYLADEDSSVAAGFYILLRAVDRFSANYNRFPGIFDGEIDEDITRLKTFAVGILSDSGFHGSTLSEDLINEMCRFGGAELHAVAAFIGGVASQEVIKLITKQFVPITGTLIFNGIDQKSQVLAL